MNSSARQQPSVWSGSEYKPLHQQLPQKALAESEESAPIPNPETTGITRVVPGRQKHRLSIMIFCRRILWFLLGISKKQTVILMFNFPFVVLSPSSTKERKSFALKDAFSQYAVSCQR